MRFIDINEDSVGVDKSILNNWALNHAFKLFAGIKAGRNFLGKFAHKGQTIYGHTYTKSGEYDNAGLNLNYTSFNSGDDNAPRAETSDDGNNTITISVNSFEKVDAQDDKTYDFRTESNSTSNQIAKNLSKWIVSKSITLFHESFIHADLSAKDYLDDKRFNNSNIIYKPSGYKSHWQHSQVLYTNNGNTSWPGDAFNGIKEVNSTFGRFYNSNQLKRMMWNYNGGKHE